MNRLTRRCLDFTVEEFRIEGWRDPQNRRLVIAAYIFAAVALLIRLFFWWYTGRTWEDALITVLHSENAASGLGLTHYLTGQGPVHGFTSPLSVLVPLIGDLLNVGWGLSLIKLVSAACGALAVIFVAGIGIHPKFNISRILLLLPIGFVALDYNQIMWGMSGMETQIVTTILLASIYYLLREKLFSTGILLGLCLLARPDMVFWVVIAGIYLLFTRRIEIVKAVIPAVVIYLPWVIFATAYYGSFIPHTVTAKYVGYYHPLVQWDPSLRSFASHAMDSIRGVFAPLWPCFGGHGTGWISPSAGNKITTILQLPEWVALCSILVAICFILLRKRKELLPLVLFILAYAVYYGFLIPGRFTWYLIPLAAVGMLVCAYGINSFVQVLINPRLQRHTLVSVTAIWLIVLVAFFPNKINTDRQIQSCIEDGVRKEIGLYLNTVMEEDQSVGCECLGYVGYYCRRTVYDYPGLCNKRVTDYFRTLKPAERYLHTMLARFRPDYIVLRPYEYELCQFYGGGADSWVLREYSVVRWFNADPERTKGIFGIWRNIDTSFVVLQRIEP